MNPYATKLAEAFAATIISIFFENSVTPMITNNDYEGEIKDKATLLNIPTVGGVTLKTYSGADMTADDLEESAGQLKTDQAKAYYFKVKSYEKLQSFIKNPEGNLMDQLKGLLQESIDAYVLGLYGDVAAGNRVGTDYTTGTVTVTTGTGAVAGSSTVFTAGMVGRGFKAAGHSVWYRVKSFSSTTAIVIEDDLDDITSAYTGGTIGAGATYTIEAATALQVTKSNIYAEILALGQKLDGKKIPKADRWLVLPSALSNLIRQAPEYLPSVAASFEDVVKNGLVTKMGGFMIFENEQVSGDSVNGYHALAGHKSAITFAMAMTDTEIEGQLIGNFGKAYKGLNVYGAKVVDERRKALAEGFWKL
jgi:hypothetical protein